MINLIKQMSAFAELWESALHIEESGQKIATLQGRLKGYRKLFDLLKKEGVNTSVKGEFIDIFPLEYDQESQRWNCGKVDYLDLMVWEEEAKDADLILKKIRVELNELVNAKKDWLFYHSTKSRDLYFIKGWHFSMSMLSDWCVAIHDGFYKAKKKHEEELQFDWVVDEK